MDDNKMLTLSSNERIPLKANMRMLFEIRDLRFATPATVSRAGIIYMSSENGTVWYSIIASWVQAQPDNIYSAQSKAVMTDLFEKYVSPSLTYLRHYSQPVIAIEDMALVSGLLQMLEGIVTPEMAGDRFKLETAFVFCAMWAFGSALTLSDDGLDSRKVFSDWWKSHFKQVRLPTRDTIFDYWLDSNSNKFEPWRQSPSFQSIEFDSRTMKMDETTVPTTETASISHWMGLLVQKHRPTLLAGPSGTGKTQLVAGMLSGLNSAEFLSTKINLNYYSTASLLLSSLEAPLQKRTGSTFGPPGSVQLIYFVDDLNLPQAAEEITFTQNSCVILSAIGS